MPKFFDVWDFIFIFIYDNNNDNFFNKKMEFTWQTQK